MNNPFKPNEETSFEKGVSIQKPIKAMSDAAKKQAKQLTDDFVAQLYGSSDDKGDPNDPTSQAAQKQAAKQQAMAAANKPHILSGTSNVGDHAKYVARKQYLEKGDTKGAEDVMFHLQHYFDDNVGTLEDRVKKFRREQEQQKMQRKKQDEEETQQKKQKEEQEKQALPQVTGKGRNRMGMPGGKKPKTGGIALQRSQTKAEMNRGASG